MNDIAIRPSRTPIHAGTAAGLLPLVGIIAPAPTAFLIGVACPLAALLLLPALMRMEATP